MRDAALGPVNLYIRIMYIMLNYVNRLLDPCSFALRSRFHAWFEAFSRVPHLDGLLPRLICTLNIAQP
ncbi:hypothetical protein IPC413_25270 [Pseudomonas aeruginosa]|nr:hypothetical protein IPC413_25270 [Pseudomonas aeruginosa]TWW15972.1 hypothetical protein FSB74_24190 [Pseudomonas aeruginosa]